MNRLERMGWTVAAQDLLGIRRSEALMLRALVLDQPGMIVTHESLAEWLGREGGFERPASHRVACRIGHARRALVDMGFPVSCVEAIPAEGYRISQTFARQIHRAVVEGSPQ